jgi:hypothetical protein
MFPLSPGLRAGACSKETETTMKTVTRNESTENAANAARDGEPIPLTAAELEMIAAGRHVGEEIPQAR